MAAPLQGVFVSAALIEVLRLIVSGTMAAQSAIYPDRVVIRGNFHMSAERLISSYLIISCCEEKWEMGRKDKEDKMVWECLMTDLL